MGLIRGRRERESGCLLRPSAHALLFSLVAHYSRLAACLLALLFFDDCRVVVAVDSMMVAETRAAPNVPIPVVVVVPTSIIPLVVVVTEAGAFVEAEEVVVDGRIRTTAVVVVVVDVSVEVVAVAVDGIRDPRDEGSPGERAPTVVRL